MAFFQDPQSRSSRSASSSVETTPALRCGRRGGRGRRRGGRRRSAARRTRGRRRPRRCAASRPERVLRLVAAGSAVGHDLAGPAPTWARWLNARLHRCIAAQACRAAPRSSRSDIRSGFRPHSRRAARVSWPVAAGGSTGRPGSGRTAGPAPAGSPRAPRVRPAGGQVRVLGRLVPVEHRGDAGVASGEQLGPLVPGAGGEQPRPSAACSRRPAGRVEPRSGQRRPARPGRTVAAARRRTAAPARRPRCAGRRRWRRRRRTARRCRAGCARAGRPHAGGAQAVQQGGQRAPCRRRSRRRPPGPRPVRAAVAAARARHARRRGTSRRRRSRRAGSSAAPAAGRRRRPIAFSAPVTAM